PTAVIGDLRLLPTQMMSNIPSHVFLLILFCCVFTAMILLVSDLGHKDKPVVFINFAIYYIQNDMDKQGNEKKLIGEYVENIAADIYVTCDAQWKHDNIEHQHRSFQLNYITEGYQYIHIDKKIYLVPQDPIIWIPSSNPHKTPTEASSVNLMSVLF